MLTVMTAGSVARTVWMPSSIMRRTVMLSSVRSSILTTLAMNGTPNSAASPGPTMPLLPSTDCLPVSTSP